MSELTILTPRLRLRPLAIEDAQPIANLVGNWNVARWLAAVPFPYTLADAEAFIIDAGLRPVERRGIVCAIAREGDLIGVASVEQRQAGPVLGFWLGEPYWGNGYMSEAAEALVGTFFARSPEASIRSGYLEGNRASARIHEKLGFEMTGHGMLSSRANGRDMPDVELLLTHTGFTSRPSRTSLP